LTAVLSAFDNRRMCRTGHNGAGLVNNAGLRRPFFLRGSRSALVEFEYLCEKQKLGGLAQVVPG